MSDDIQLFADFCKIDEEARQVFGYASTPTRDAQGEIMSIDALKAALPAYLSFPTVREMHQPSAAGVGIAATLDENGLYFGAQVVDDQAWRKVKAKVYRGFSVGGKITKRDPADRSIITGIALHEISLVDRPSNPDAKFDLVKRAPDGQLRVQPSQVWACGVPGHQHAVKADAQACMEGRALLLRARQETGGYPLIGETQELAQAMAKQHFDAAAQHRLDEQRHTEAARLAGTTDDIVAYKLHENLAKLGGGSAAYHERIARTYERLGNPTEDVMDGSVQAAMADAQAQMEALHKAILTDAPALTPFAKAQSSCLQGQNASALAIAEIAATIQAHATSAAALADGAPDKAKHGFAEMAAHATVAAAHARAAQSYQAMVADAFKPDPGASAHGANEDSICNTSKAMAKMADPKECAEVAAKAKKSADEMVEACDKAAKTMAEGKTCDEDAVKAFSASLKGFSQTGTSLSKALGIICERLTDMAADKRTDPKAGDPDRTRPNLDVPGVLTDTGLDKPTKELVKSAKQLARFRDGVLDKNGIYFGKRDFTDKERQAMADKGHALPDGSFPIENKDDLSNAVRAIGRAKDPAKAKAHIKARAKDLGASDELPDDWMSDDKEAAAKAAYAKEGAMKEGAAKAADAKDDGDKKPSFSGAKEPFDSKDDAKDAAAKAAKTYKSDESDSDAQDQADEDAQDAQDQADQDAQDVQDCKDECEDDGLDKMTTRVISLRTAALALHGLRALRSDGTAGALAKAEGTAQAIKDNIAALQKIVADQALMLNTNVLFKQVMGSVGTSADGPSWMTAVGQALHSTAMAKGVPDIDRHLRSTLADRIAKWAMKAQKDHAQKAVDAPGSSALAANYAKPDPNQETQVEVGAGTEAAKRADEERAEAIKAFKTVSGQMAALTKMVLDSNARSLSAQAENKMLQERLAKVEAEPLPPPRVGLPEGYSTTKEADSLNSVDLSKLGGGPGIKTTGNSVVDRFLAIPAGKQRAEALANAARTRRP